MDAKSLINAVKRRQRYGSAVCGGGGFNQTLFHINNLVGRKVNSWKNWQLRLPDHNIKFRDSFQQFTGQMIQKMIQKI